uniref:WhiB family transcriptional regulator n=1 Tax=Frankia sp. Cr1 TaxID=3073931 RepID=UPI002AD3730D
GLFFPPEGLRGAQAAACFRAAKKICAPCGVRQECLDHALATSELYGVWGGLTPRERTQLVRDGRR